MSPQASVAARQRRKILSPKRQRFENNFEKFMTDKYVNHPIEELPGQQRKLEEERPPFDTTTRFEGSMNATIAARDRVKEFIEGKKATDGQVKSLFNIEKECMLLIKGETVVNLSNELLENLRRVYVASKLRGEEELEDVEVEEYFYNICEDPFLERRLHTIVRETTDQERETLDSLLYRVEKEHGQKRIQWEQFMVFFTRRGKLRTGEGLMFSGMAIEEIETARIESQRYQPEDPQAQKVRLQRGLKEKLVAKQNLVMYGGKGKYDVTVPDEFGFMKRKPSHSKTIRAQWLEEELAK